MSRSVAVRLGACLLALLALAGCETISEKRKIDYRNTPVLPPLEVPPDLSTIPDRDPPAQAAARGGTTTYSSYIGDKKTQTAKPGQVEVLPQYPGVRLVRDGQTRYLVVTVDAKNVWNSAREFFLKNGLLIAEENAQTGVIETEWAENRANVGNAGQKVLAKWLSSLYSTGTRDKYRLRLERGVQPGTTEIYLSHQGMEEFVPENPGTSGPSGSYWRPRASDPELEAEMLQRLVVYLGGEQAATQVARASTTATDANTTPAAPAAGAQLRRAGEGPASLALQDSLDRAWRRVGLSLDRIGFTVEDRDRSKGIYYVRYIDPDQATKKKGFFSRMFGSDEPNATRNQYQVRVKPAQDGTQVEVLGKDGAPETSKTGERILSLLYEQLK